MHDYIHFCTYSILVIVNDYNTRVNGVQGKSIIMLNTIFNFPQQHFMFFCTLKSNTKPTNTCKLENLAERSEPTDMSSLCAHASHSIHSPLPLLHWRIDNFASGIKGRLSTGLLVFSSKREYQSGHILKN